MAIVSNKKAQLLNARVQRTSRRRLLGMLAVFVVVATVAVLMVPAISMTRGELVCGLEEHVHTDACYEQVLICGYDSDEAAIEAGHEHTDACYELRLTCETPEHVHSSACYDEPVAVQSDNSGDEEIQSDLDGQVEEGEQSASDDEVVQPAANDDANDSETQLDEENDSHSDDDLIGDIDDGQTNDIAVENNGESADTDDSDANSNAGDSNATENDSNANATMPAQAFDGELIETDEEGVEHVTLRVHVEAPKGAFPADTTMQIKEVVSEQIIDAVDEAVIAKTDGKVRQLQAVDITFLDANTNQIEPERDITVTLESPLVAQTDKPLVVHVDDEGKADMVDTLTKKQLKKRNIGVEEDQLLFDSSDFSIYGIVVTTLEQTLVASDGQTYIVTVICPPEAGVPENADLNVTEVLESDDEWTDYTAQVGEELNENVGFARFFDINIVDASGNEIQPEAAVSVKISLADAKEIGDEMKVVHFGDDGLELVDATLDDDTVAFEAGGFSVYGVVGVEMLTTQVITESGDTLQVTVEVSDQNDIARFKGLRVNELTSRDDAYWTAYDAVVAQKQATDANFDEETFGFFATDIALLDKNGNVFEPEGSVNVKMELINLPADADTLTSSMEVQHLAEKNGDITVETVAGTEDLKTEEDVIAAQFNVESFSTFTLTWTGEGESDVISDDDAKAVLSIQSGSDTYATVNVHYADIYGNNVTAPSSTYTATTPVTIEGLLNEGIEGYVYQEAHTESYTGDEITSIAVRRTNGTPITKYNSLGTTGGSGRPSNWYPSTSEIYYGDINGSKARVYYRNISGTWRFMTSETQNGNNYRYASGTVYTRETGTSYDYTLTLNNNDSVVATETNNTVGTWNNAADIYLVYRSTNTNLKHATIHYGTLNADGSFTELQETTSLDTNAASISLKSSINGYEYVGAYYCTSETDTPAVDSVTIMPTLRKVEDMWQYTDTSVAAVTGFVEDGSHIYVSFKEKSSSGTPTPSEGEIPTPSTIKNVTDNGDGTYDIQLDIIGQEITHEETKGANVLLIFDRTSSMSSSMTGAENRFEAAKSAVRTLITALNPNKNPVQMAVFSFDRNANQGISWTTSGTAITNYTDTLTMAPSGATPGGGGTNWEAAFVQAKTYLATADADPTYVIFLTDGNPTIYVGSNSINSATANSLEYTRARAEAAELSSSLKMYGILCANQSDGPLLQTLVNDLNSATYGSHDMTHILANDSTTLTNTFNNIASHIVEQLGDSNVSTQDGVTSLSSVSASVSGAAGSFNYYKAYEVTVRDGHYYYVDDSGVEQEVAATDVQEYTYQDSEGNEQSYLYCNRATWAGAPGAAYSAESGVTWDLGSEGKLNKGCIYSVSFTVWPSQEAYDLLADLNNGLKEYDDLDPEVKDQVYESNGVYYMKTNTTLDTTYTFGNDTYTDNIPYHQGAMDLDSENISLMKQWPANLLDQYGAATYRDENGQELTATEITLTITKDEESYMDVTVKAGDEWKKDDVFISCGVMTVHDGVADIKEPGHDYTVIEPGSFSYYWDLIADVYHPMVINGETTMLILDKDATDAMVDNSNYFKINDKIYKREAAEELVLKAANYRRSNLNITKTVSSANAPADAMFEYTVTVKDEDSTDGYVWFSAWDSVASEAVKDTDWVISGAAPEAGNTGYWYAINGAQIKFKIKAGWNVRFLNLKHDSTFSIEESNAGEGFSLESINATTQYELTSDWFTVDETNEALITGTIAEPNNSYTVTYTNRWDTIDVQLKKVDDHETTLSGSTFALDRWSASWTSVQSEIKPGDTATSTSNPVDLGGLGVGRYRLTEKEAPDGYIILNNHVFFEVYKEGTTLKARLTDENGEPVTSPTDDASIDGPGSGEIPTYIITVSNTPGQELPMTGGSGTMHYTLGGLMLIIISALICAFKMRRRESLDC